MRSELLGDGNQHCLRSLRQDPTDGPNGVLFGCSWAMVFFPGLAELDGCYDDAIVAILALYDSAAVQLCRKPELRCFWVLA
jgi:hypothetical protein